MKNTLPIRQDIEITETKPDKHIGHYLIPNGTKAVQGDYFYDGPGFDIVPAKLYEEYLLNKDKK